MEPSYLGGIGNSRAADVADPCGMAAVHEDGRSGDRELANDRAEGPANAPRKDGRLSLVAAASGTAASGPIKKQPVEREHGERESGNHEPANDKRA